MDYKKNLELIKEIETAAQSVTKHVTVPKLVKCKECYYSEPLPFYKEHIQLYCRIYDICKNKEGFHDLGIHK